MTELPVKFGGRLGTVVDPKSGVQVEGHVFGDVVLRAVDETKFARFLNSVGGEVGGADAAKSMILEHASEMMRQRTAELGVMQAIDHHFADALVASANPTFHAYGAELVVREFNVNLSPESVEALKAGSQQQGHERPRRRKSYPAIRGAIGLLVLAATGAYVYSTSARPSKSPTLHSGWDGTRPYVCNGHDDVVFGGFIADLPNQTAISASEHCRLKLEGVKLTAAIAIEASGNALVVVNGGSIEGTTAAVHVSGNAHVIFKGTALKGQTASDGNGKITGP
jgi:hypothetical protein